ncbi:MAG TPA: SCO6880 family protein, partial [Acidimicrobiia bacterium]|nr:SCO6880 family protein [Acidimicrobiia bacterium]
FWVGEWPRIPVRHDFLSPLLLGSRATRTVSLTVEAVPPGRAARQVEAARTADLADEELRRRGGFLSSARRRRQAEGVARREEELADGHSDCRFSGYLTVSAPDPEALEDACGEVEQLAQQCRLQLTRLRGQQAEAFTWTLPLARGLR